MNIRAPLTEKQDKVYSYLVSYIRENKYPPTIREIQESFGYRSSNSVVSQLKKLQKKGYITKASSKNTMRARTVTLVDDLVGNYSIESSRLKRALSVVENKGHAIKINEAIELLSALEINVV